jgi:hypothetical protein
MALSAVGLGAPQFYRGDTAQAAPQKNITQQSKDLSDAVNALRSPTVVPLGVRASTGTQMATLCLVQPGDSAGSSGNSNFNGVVSAYSTVLAD